MQLAEASQRLSEGEFTLQFQIQCGFPGKPVEIAEMSIAPSDVWTLLAWTPR
jgi:hypothetical protein